MKRKFLIYGIVTIFMILGIILSHQFIKTYQEKNNVAQQLERLPEFTMQSTNGVGVTNKSLSNKNTTVFIFFNSECHYCQEEAQQLVEINTEIKGINFLWVSSEPMETIKIFQDQYRLSDYPNCDFLQDPKGILAASLDISTTPQFLIYDAENKLVKNHKGAWRIDKLLEFLINEP